MMYEALINHIDTLSCTHVLGNVAALNAYCIGLV